MPKMLMKIRKSMAEGLSDDLLSGITEGDEAWFGKKKSKPKEGKKIKHKTDNQQIVLGITERERKKLRLIVIPNVQLNQHFMF